MTSPASSTAPVERRYPVLLNDYCRRLAAASKPAAKLYLPDSREMEEFQGTASDGLGELAQMPVARLIHRYTDRAVLLCTSACFVHCRFCFRKRLWRDGSAAFAISDAELDGACAYLTEHPEIEDILLSGGDVLTLPDERVLAIIRRIRGAGNVRAVRVCSRAPAVAPARITKKFAAALGKIDGVWFVTHFDHPDELTPEAETACRRLVGEGIPVLDQTVLLNGVNDDPETLKKLFHKLVSWRVKPLYLFHIDPVEGVGHFATGVARGLEIMADFRDSLGSLATPRFAIDLPEGGGKVILTPDNYEPSGVYYSPILKRNVRHPLA